MSEPFKSIPDPMLPEYRLLKDVGELPALSPGLRERVVLNVHRQVRYGRWKDRLQIIASTAAVLLLVTCVWTFRPNRLDRATTESPVYHPGSTPSTIQEMSPGSTSASQAAAPVKPIERNDQGSPAGGGQSPRQDLNEMQQINRLIEQYQLRQNTICGLLPIF